MRACSKYLLFFSLLLPSCSGYHAGSVYRVENERVIPKSFEQVWESVVDFCRINNFQITETDTTTGFLSFYGSSERPDLDSTFDCGDIHGIDGEIASRNFKCNVILHRASWDSTLVTVRPYETAAIRMNERDRWVSADCNSTGKFEHRLLDALAEAPTHFTIERIDSSAPAVTSDIDVEDYSGWKVWVGGAMIPFTMRNIRDVHLSDWQYHLSDSAEGRLLLPLTELKTDGNHGGLEAAIGHDVGAWTPFGEIQLDFIGSGYAVQVCLGTLLNVGHSGNLSFNVVPKIGWLGVNTDLVLSTAGNRYSSVELGNNTFYDGDTASVRVNGFTMQLGLDAEYAVTERMSLYLSGSYCRTSFGNVSISANGSNFDLASGAIVEPVLTKGFGSTQHATISPQTLSTGLAVELGMRVRMHW